MRFELRHTVAVLIFRSKIIALRSYFFLSASFYIRLVNLASALVVCVCEKKRACAADLQVTLPQYRRLY
jgi:hypothetical protein